MNKPFFTGVCTALVTPFLNGEINYPMLERLLRRQIDAGIEAVVICGTTGESASLSDPEKLTMFERAKEYVGNECKIIAGTGSNNTEHAVQLSMQAEHAGADAILSVSPYYNKATDDGLYLHYYAVADSVDIPVILYNVPSRTGMDIPISVYKRLSLIPNIIGVKEASRDVAKAAWCHCECGTQFSIWSGNDDLAVPVMSIGGAGVISVASNLMPVKMQAMAKAALDGDFDTAASLQLELMPLIRTLFAEVNPVPVKAAMKLIGFDCGGCRLPLSAPSEKTMKELHSILAK